MTNQTFAGFTYPKFLGDLRRGSLVDRLAEFKARKLRGQSFDMLTGYRSGDPIPSGKPDGCFFYLESDLSPVLRWQYCDKVQDARIDHTGWFSDEYGDGDKIRGIVVRLNHNRGFIPGWTMGEGMCTELDCDIRESEIDCAYAADRLAERVAEKNREYIQDEERREKQERDDNCPTCKPSITMSDILHPAHDYCDECRSLLCV